MSTPSPAPNRTPPQQRRRDGLAPLILIALLLAVLPIGCIAEVALRLITPNNDPFKDVGSSAGLGAYRPFPPGISFAAVDPALGNLQETEIARRELTPVGVGGGVTVAPVSQVAPAMGVTVPPTPTSTVPATPRPTVTPAPQTTDVAGGVQPTATPTSAVVIPGITTTPAPTSTPTRTPTTTPPARPELTPTSTATTGPGLQPTPSATAAPTVSATPAATLSPTIPAVGTPLPTLSPSATPSSDPTRTPIRTPTLVPICLLYTSDAADE